MRSAGREPGEKSVAHRILRYMAFSFMDGSGRGGSEVVDPRRAEPAILGLVVHAAALAGAAEAEEQCVGHDEGSIHGRIDRRRADRALLEIVVAIAHGQPQGKSRAEPWRAAGAEPA